MRIELSRKEVEHPGGVEIAVRGFKGDSGATPAQVFIEFYDGKLRVHVWDGHTIPYEDVSASHEIEAINGQV